MGVRPREHLQEVIKRKASGRRAATLAEAYPVQPLGGHVLNIGPSRVPVNAAPLGSTQGSFFMCTPHGKFVAAYLDGGKAHGLVVPIRCHKWTCEYCGKKKRKQLFARALNGAIAQPVKGFRPQYTHKLLTLTCPGSEYRAAHTPAEALADMTAKWNLMNRALKKRLGNFHYIKVLEWQKDGFPHFHILLAGRVIVPKSILNEFRRAWTEYYGMGNIDIQKNSSGTIKELVRYILKYLTKTNITLPKGKRLFTASRGALAPLKKPEPKIYIVKKLLWQFISQVESPQTYTEDSMLDLIKHDEDLKEAIIERWHRDQHYMRRVIQ